MKTTARMVLFLPLTGLLAPPATADDDRPIKVLLIGKDRDHPPQTHEYMFECELLAKCLAQSPRVRAEVSNGWPEDARELEGVDVLVLYTAMGGDVLFDPKRRDQVETLLKQGAGLVMIHWSTGAGDGPPGAWQLSNLGGWFGFAFSKIPVRDSTVRRLDPAHPVCRGWSDFVMRDEYYTDLKFHPHVKPLASAEIDGKAHTIAWTFERPDKARGRSFGTVCGHFHDCFGNENFRRMLCNAILWSARRNVPEAGAPCDLKPDDLVLPPDPRTPPRPEAPKPVDDRSWADAAQPVRDGLALWLDAQAQVRAFPAHESLPPRDGEQVAIWFDASGHKRHAVQRTAAAQPRFAARDGFGRLPLRWTRRRTGNRGRAARGRRIHRLPRRRPALERGRIPRPARPEPNRPARLRNGPDNRPRAVSLPALRHPEHRGKRLWRRPQPVDRATRV